MPKLFELICRSEAAAAHPGFFRRADLLETASRDTAMRSQLSSFFYLLVFVIVTGFSPFLDEHPRLTIGIGVTLVFGTALRALFVWYFDSLYRRSPMQWLLVSSFGALLQALSWGMLCIMSIHFYGWQWPTMISCLSAAAFSAGVVITLSPLYFLSVTYLLLILSPTLVISLIDASQQSLIAAMLFATYILFLISAARRLNREYWEGKLNIHLLDDKAKQLQKKNKELEAFAYSVSHDLRAPLRAIDGYGQILLEESAGKLNDAEREWLTRIRGSAQRMGQLIDDLLKLSRVSNGVCAPREVNLSHLVEASFDKLKAAQPARHVELEIEPDVRAMADPSLIDIAVQNLADNAWKYSSEHAHPKIRFGVRRQGSRSVYFIKNDGAGFDVRYADKLFKPFQRLHDDKHYAGTGIGLATVRRVVERHNGAIWANAKINKGATFYFTLSST